MNYVEEIFQRCNMEKLSYFLMQGDEMIETNDGGYHSRLIKADERLDEWLNGLFPERKELDENSSFIYSVLSEIQSVYMEIGLRAGIMLVGEFLNKKS